ncbi:MAG TPA: hypothetical protein VNE39_25800 [Planctomycetota bacterium]|nr:hypothetical protein [Planctomycetota bacterium]
MRCTTILWLALATSGLGATVSETLLEEQLDLLANKDIKTTVRILRKLNKFFLLEHEEATPPLAPTDAQKQAGCVLFTRNYLEPVYYNSNPRPYEVRNELKLFATPGEYEPVSFAVLPLADLQNVAVTCSDFLNPRDARLKSSIVDARFVRQLARGVKPFMWMVGPEALEPFTTLNIPQGRTTQLWLTVRPPDDATPGAYEGTVTLKPANRPATALKLTVVVLPFKLLEDPDMAFGWYYGTPSDPAQLRRELADLRAHGCTSLTIHGPKIKSIAADGKVEIDFSHWDELRKLCAELGFHATKQTDIGGITDAITRIGIKELGPGFDVPFVAALREIKKWLDAHPDFRVVFCIYDEPRESLLNSWNRTFDQTVAYIKLCRQVPGLLITVNPMGDGSDKKDYTPFGGMVDILNTHAWRGSKGLIERTRKAGKTLWVYNNGQARLPWGFGVWRVGAKGEWEWTYSGAGGPDCYSPIPTGGYENEGESNTGRFPVYRFADRIVPTPRYEWCREGTDDYKYLFTLLTRLKAAKDGEAKAGADALLKEMWDTFPEYPAMGLKTGAEAGASGDPAQLLAYFDHFRWRIALAILALDDAAIGRKKADPLSFHSAYSRFKFGEIPPKSKAEATKEAPAAEQAIEVEKTALKPGAKVLFDFEDDACLKQLETDRGGANDPFDPDIMPAKRVKRAATHGNSALYYEPVEKGGGLHLIHFDGDWSGFDVLRIDFVNPNRRPVNGYLCITDAKTPVPYPRAMGNYDDRFDQEAFVVPPGKFIFELKLGGLSANNGRQLDLSKIRKIALGLDGSKVPYYLDCIRLEKEK